LSNDIEVEMIPYGPNSRFKNKLTNKEFYLKGPINKDNLVS